MKAHLTKILGVSIDSYSCNEIDGLLSDALQREKAKYFVATINPEILLKCQKDKEYKNILNKADLRLCDGFGIRLVSLLKGRNIYSRYTGVEVLDFMLKKAKIMGLKVLVIARDDSLSIPEDIVRAVEEKYEFRIGAKYYSENNIFESEELKSAQIIIVNFGAPDQEKIIFESRDKFPAARLLVGVGGAFDFLTNRIRRAPRSMQKMGLEWLWRLMQEPKRIKRIFSAVVVFPLKVIISGED
jgi:N-acetylglucosaminyldiphosphoundecaprenol N-acetyl-beta-D-mannosaminyltransferase